MKITLYTEKETEMGTEHRRGMKFISLSHTQVSLSFSYLGVLYMACV